jgi:4a-hydroxytetrahydrobiopterin dehydratase
VQEWQVAKLELRRLSLCFPQRVANNPKIAPEEMINSLPENWKNDGNALTRTFLFSSYTEAVAFLVRVAFFAEQEQHHPDVFHSYRKVTLKLTTHDAGSVVTDKDVSLARLINTL